MDWLNYHHLLYFWMVVREGGVQPAARALGVTHPTVSAQIKQLEAALDQSLFQRRGRRLELTEFGSVAYRYAEDIFALGREFMDVAQGRVPSSGVRRFVVGITDAMPKLVVRAMLGPLMSTDEPIHVVCRHGRHDRLMSELVLREVDVVLADAPVPAASAIRAFNHELGRCGLSFFAAPQLAAELGERAFPEVLEGSPFLAPIETTSLGRNLRQWLHELAIAPRVVAEFDDSALMKAFGQAGLGIFATPSVVEAEVASQYGVVQLGRSEVPEERFYAISLERRVRDPAVSAVCRAARDGLFE